MHTAFDLKPAQFEVRLEGQPAGWPEVFPGWSRHDRFGIVVTEPLGGLGASLLIQLAILAFYESDPSRRRAPARYPDIYLFHVGGRFGDFSAFDFWPPRKEIFLPADPAAVLESLNDHAITRLAVPDGAPVPGDFAFKEPASALERIDSCFAYHPDGRARGADLVLRARDEVLARYAERALDPAISLERGRKLAVPDDPVRRRDRLRWVSHVESRLAEVPPDEAARRRAARLRHFEDGLPVEALRRIATERALDLLAAPAVALETL